MSTLPALQVTESDLRFLTAGWSALTGACGAGETADRWLAALTRLYSGPERHYHNLRHVAEMLRLLGQFHADAADYSAVRFAAWFHDAVYDTRKGTNEDESAALAEQALGELGFPSQTTSLTRRLILATKRHEAEGGPPGLGLFLDADLAILGAPEDTYAAYSEAIRREYAWVPEGDYREGRLKVLTNFLRRGRLFYTGQMAARFEAQARRNLSNEIKGLSA